MLFLVWNCLPSLSLAFPIAESIDVTTERYLATFIPAFPSCLCYLRECLWPSSSSTHFIRNQTSSLLLHWGKHSNSKAREKIWYLWIHILHRLADVPLLAQLQIQYIARSCKAFFRELAMFASSSFPLCSGCQSNLWFKSITSFNIAPVALLWLGSHLYGLFDSFLKPQGVLK